MNIEIGKNALITTNEWFLAPDGSQYKAVFGEIKGVFNDSDVLGVKTNRNSTNWYIEVGCMTIAGCQVHYAIRTDSVDLSGGGIDAIHELDYKELRCANRIYEASE